MKWKYSNGSLTNCYFATLFIMCFHTVMVVDASAYDPTLPAAVDKPFLREPCLAVVEELDYEPTTDDANAISDQEDSWLYCETPGGYFYKVPTTDPDWIEHMVQGGTLVSGVTELSLPSDTVVNEDLGILEWNHDEMVAPGLVQLDDTTGANHTAGGRRRRRLAQVTGTKTVLAVRVRALDQQNTFDEATLRKEVFGTDNTNLRTQFEKCSFGQLRFIPTQNRRGRTGVTISGGVVTVTVNRLATEGDSVLRNAVTSILKQEFGVSTPANLADHVMYCLPSRSMNGIAYAYINSWLSVYKDVWGLFVSAQMHEFGHNLNLAHATDFKFLSHDRARSEYDDKTGLMGYSYNHKEYPKMCFNPAKSWQLKWYRNKEASYLPTCEVVTMDIGGIIDYRNSAVETVLLQFNQLDKNKDYYLTYNARASFNRETQEGGNKVVIDAQGGNGWSYSRSTLEARLEVGESFAMRNFNGIDGDTVTVRFVERVGFSNREAKITIVWTPRDSSICRNVTPRTMAPVTLDPTSAPTEPPTQFPTTAPSPLPTSGPSGSPTTSPIGSPTGGPSEIPSLEPSSNPTPIPSKAASTDPTLTPSIAPSPNPTVSPTVRPTRVPSPSPTKDPTMLPTLTASDIPTGDPTKRPTSSPTEVPTVEPTIVPSDLPSPRPTSRPPTRGPTTPPTAVPTKARIEAPSSNPSQGPTFAPSKDPTRRPTISPSARPTFIPTATHSVSPTMDPTDRPTVVPSKRPTSTPTVTPSTFPTEFPTVRPTLVPSEEPTSSPSVTPTEAPSPLPTFKPSTNPSLEPSATPTATPSSNPSDKPTSMPSLNPTPSPSIQPSRHPTPAPSPRPTASPPVNQDCQRWYWFMIPECKGQRSMDPSM